MAESNVNLMVVLNTCCRPGFDVYELVFGPNRGLTRLGGWHASVPAWLREVSWAMRRLIDDYTDYIRQGLIRQEMRERERVWVRTTWGGVQVEEKAGRWRGPIVVHPKTLFMVPHGWGERPNPWLRCSALTNDS